MWPGLACFGNMFVFMVDRYFRKENMFGLACFENMPVDSHTERGARMKSVGILATSYTLLYRHMQFLEAQVRFAGMYILLGCLWVGRRKSTVRTHTPLLQHDERSNHGPWHSALYWKSHAN